MKEKIKNTDYIIGDYTLEMAEEALKEEQEARLKEYADKLNEKEEK